MSEEAARTLVYVIAMLGGVFWLFGARFLHLASREGEPNQLAETRFSIDHELGSATLMHGSAEVNGTPERLAALAAATLSREGPNRLGLIKVLEQTDDRVVFEGLGADVAAQASGVTWTGLRRGEFRFKALTPNRTRIDYVVQTSGGRWLIWLGAGFVALGLIALLVGSWASLTYLVHSPNPGVRGQVFQLIQVVHFLWPPFLFGQLYRGRKRALRAGFEALVHNLPYQRI